MKSPAHAIFPCSCPTMQVAAAASGSDDVIEQRLLRAVGEEGYYELLEACGTGDSDGEGAACGNAAVVAMPEFLERQKSVGQQKRAQER